MTPYTQLQTRLQAEPHTWLVTGVAGPCRADLSLRAPTRNPSRQASQHRFGQEYMQNRATAPVQSAQPAI